MRVFNSLEKLPEFKNTVFTQGTFDGVHLGHQKILEQLAKEARSVKGESVLLTFWPHPRLFLYPGDKELKLLQTLDEKLKVLEACGVDNVVVLPFDKKMSFLLPEEYIRTILVKSLGISRAIVGYDHRFGRNREGDIEILRHFSAEFGYTVKEIEAKDIDEITISSTKIRKALLSGEIDQANEFLGRPYSFTAQVVHGQKIGRTISYPTANLEIDHPNKLIPANGVYAVKCLIDGEYFNGMMNIGNNPTIEGKGFSIEVHIFDFHKEIYGQTVEIQCVSRLREEKKFASLEELTLILQLDEKNAREVLSRF